MSYDSIANESVQAAFGSTNILGRGKVWIPLNGGIEVTAYHAPQFTSNIIAVHELTELFGVHFSSTFKPYKACFIFEQNTKNILYEAKCIDGLYTLKMDRKFSAAASRTALVNPAAKEWHDKTGHPSARRYLQLSRMFDTVPSFHISTMNDIRCIPCITGKARQAPVRAVQPRVEHPIQEVHLDISGPFSVTIAGEKYAVHFIDAFTAKSHVSLLQSKGQLAQVLLP